LISTAVARVADVQIKQSEKVTVFAQQNQNGCRAFLLLLAAVLCPLWMPSITYGTLADSASMSHTVLRTTAEVTVDGLLDELDWQASEIIMLGGYKGEPVKQPTQCRLLWDDTYLYISWLCTDTDIWSTLTERDDPLYNEEVVEAFINPDSDRETYLELEVNPLGTLWDGKIVRASDGRSADIGWNSALKWAMHAQGTVNDAADSDSCWSVEIAMPMSEMLTAANIPPLSGDSWRINLYRIDVPGGDRDKLEYSAWSPVSVNFHDPDRFGEIVFSSEPVRVLRGDTNDDGAINIFDLLNLLRALKDDAIGEGKAAYDVDASGQINIFDILALLRKMRISTDSPTRFAFAPQW